MSKNKGFTIVELLVVIVVIGILAAITIVSYSGVSNKARTASNQSNANSVLQAAMGVHAETGSYPATDASAATVLGNLNAGVTKVPSGLLIDNTQITSTNYDKLLYLRNAGGTGVCIGYWDYSAEAPAAVFIYGGSATAGVNSAPPTCT